MTAPKDTIEKLDRMVNAWRTLEPSKTLGGMTLAQVECCPERVGYRGGAKGGRDHSGTTTVEPSTNTTKELMPSWSSPLEILTSPFN